MRGFTVAAVVVVVALTGCEPVPDNQGGTSQKGSAVLAGRTNPAVTQATIDTTICRKGYTKKIRPSSSYTGKVKRKMLAKQHPGGRMSDYILDHLIPLQGGGAPSDERNFLLQTRAASFDKDAVEDRMRDDVCDHGVPLRKAQEAMASDWRNYCDVIRPGRRCAGN